MNEIVASGWVNFAGFIAVLALLWSVQRGLRRDMADLRERMARLEGLVKGFIGRREAPLS